MRGHGDDHDRGVYQKSAIPDGESLDIQTVESLILGSPSASAYLWGRRRQEALDALLYRLAIAAKSGTARPNDLLRRCFQPILRERRKALHENRFLWPAIEKRADVELEIRQVLKLGRGNDDVEHLGRQPRAFTTGRKFTNECVRIIVADPERHDGAAIAEDGRDHLVGKLR